MRNVMEEQSYLNEVSTTGVAGGLLSPKRARIPALLK